MKTKNFPLLLLLLLIASFCSSEKFSNTEESALQDLGVTFVDNPYAMNPEEAAVKAISFFNNDITLRSGKIANSNKTAITTKNYDVKVAELSKSKDVKQLV